MADEDRVAGEEDSVHDRCLKGVASELRSLGLTENMQIVQGEMTPSLTLSLLPCVFVTAEGAPETIDELQTFETDSTDYPVQVLFADRTTTHDKDRVPAFTSWRRTALRRFRKMVRINDVPECYNVSVSPKLVFDPDRYGTKYQFVVSGFTVICHCEEPREGREDI